jgi:hypothetical protein
MEKAGEVMGRGGEIMIWGTKTVKGYGEFIPHCSEGFPPLKTDICP